MTSPDPHDWRRIKLSAVLQRHPEIAAKLADYYACLTLGNLADLLRDFKATVRDIDILAEYERAILAGELDRVRGFDGKFAAAVSRCQLGLEEASTEGVVK